ncbi:MAG: DUF1934 domain-containing protein [Acutalibacteraceae bacterium]
MKEDYLMTMVTHQNVEGEKEVIEMTTVADFVGDTDDYYISYTDDDGDLKGCRTTLHVENGSCITITREGSYDSHMIVEQNARHISHHTTPYGSFSLGVCAIDIESQMTRRGGKLNFRYSTDIDMRPMGEIEFNIEIEQRNINA